ncbi:branched-chain amino acid ABC transporter [Burkholderia pseudomultivorans]|uniref:branched-chain amino acid ABC transporter n=1 Tax=Burkholderia pseudomultivorans TaxID=1207504 RepID=UPI0028756F9F|nr:branched-chain amino acid ABC transporter [Burkholderia pseudomultivorans]MDS0793714.1 branched-chain amino acid ABC transporter [Burkholderia pseudomultivorans]
MALKTGFGKARETYSMHVKLAYAVSVAVPVAMAAGCSKKSDGGAGSEAAAFAARPASDVRVARTGRAASLGRRIAQSGKDKGNGARLAIEDMHTAGRTRPVVRRAAARAGQAAGRASAGTRTAFEGAGDPGATSDGRRIPAPHHFDSTKQLPATADPVAAGRLVRAMDSDAVLTNVGCGFRVALAGGAAAGGSLAKQATVSGIGMQTLGGSSVHAGKVVEPANDAARNLICAEAGFASRRTEKGSDSGNPDDGRFGMLPNDFKEAKHTVLDVVTI